ncbi:MAG: hypothetical protein H6773_01955 [Pseudomonadales bacterium]|nr:hypothetical protein [Candidatus Woesebacteria bacterium]MCB9800921.1 hypothetical protein [Pseudomonadales bacterium]
MKQFLKHIIKIDRLLDQQWPLFVALVLLFVLRVPNLVEPYWYGDEGIYLTIGQSMNKGVLLYQEIIDHKTPIIYFLAQTHTQLNFRLLLIGWMLVTTAAFYYFAQKLFAGKRLPAFLATLVFVVATTLPSFEGNIPNGELFVMGFVLMGLLILSRTEYVAQLLESKKVLTTHSWFAYLTSGVFLSLGVLTKVPAIFDIAAALGFGYFATTNACLATKKKRAGELIKRVSANLPVWIVMGVGILIPIVISIVYFVSKGAGQAYLDFGLLYNFRYAGSWQLPFTNPLLLFFFTLQGKVVAMGLLTLVLTLLRKYVTPAYQFILFWFGLSLFASLLSNRPYPHYYLQIVPAFSLVVAGTLSEGYSILTSLKKRATNVLGPLLGLGLLGIFFAILVLLDVRPYPSLGYYTSFMQLAQGKISVEEYNQRFDVHMRDNYKAVDVMKVCPDDHLFIWGTNPMLYALSDRIPTGRFTVSFHIKDFDAYDETYNDLVEDAPSFIVVMNSETSDFPEFYEYLSENYRQTPVEFDNFTLWNRMDCKVTE